VVSIPASSWAQDFGPGSSSDTVTEAYAWWFRLRDPAAAIEDAAPALGLGARRRQEKRRRVDSALLTRVQGADGAARRATPETTVTLSLEDMAARVGEQVERLREWQALGLLRTAGVLGPRDLAQVRLVQYLVRHGLEVAHIAERLRTHRAEVEAYLALLHPTGDVEGSSLVEAASRVGLPLDAVRRLVDTIGLRAADDLLTPEDVAMLEFRLRAIEAGMDEQATLQLVRVYRDALARVAEAEVRVFHFYVHEPLRATGLEGEALLAETHARSAMLFPLIEPTLAYFHRRGLAAASREDLLLHMGAGPTALAPTAAPAQLAAGIVFTDLSSFTSMTETKGDVHATAVVRRFGEIAHDAAERWAGRVVKQIGDACMLVFFEPGAAVSCALDIGDAVAAEPSFPAARSGVHWGPVLYREGDYFGAGVNLAARLVGVAERQQVIVSASVRERLIDAEGIELSSRGTRALKGIADQQELFEARRATLRVP
jgi:class 3 adenylate cyclase